VGSQAGAGVCQAGGSCQVPAATAAEGDAPSGFLYIAISLSARAKTVLLQQLQKVMHRLASCMLLPLCVHVRMLSFEQAAAARFVLQQLQKVMHLLGSCMVLSLCVHVRMLSC